MKKAILSIVMLVLLFSVPIQALAEDFTIKDFTIDARLADDGNVQVNEQLTYDFNGNFNGITRDLYPKKGSEIKDLRAEENGKALEVTEKDGRYNIHRKAKDETVVVELTYTIIGGVEKYTDMAQFYWPFFDDRNETDFSNVVISVYPPEPTKDVIAMGDDAAREKASVEEDGSVVFALGSVPSGEKADVRIGYDAMLFGSAPLASKDEIRPVLEKEQASLAAAQARYDQLHQTTGQIAPYIAGGAAGLLVLAVIYALRVTKRRKEAAERDYPDAYFVPDPVMSLPATIQYTTQIPEGASVQTAAFLDLLRKGYIEKKEEETFRVVSRNTEYPHERLLIEWLFDGFGDGETFSFDNLDVLNGDELVVQKDGQKYREKQSLWENAVLEERKERELKGDVKAVRVTTVVAGILMIPFVVTLGVYDQWMWLALSLVPSIALILFGLIYNPKTVKGHGIDRQWKAFRERLPEVSEADFNDQLDNEQKRAVIYGIGTHALENNKLFTSNALKTGHQPAIMFYFLTGTETAHYLTRADTAVAASVSSSSSAGTSGGGGVGGGGGGAGAF